MDNSIENFRLSALKCDEIGEIVEITEKCEAEARRRLLDLGFVKGALIKVAFNSPSRNPVAYRIKGALIALRNREADEIIVKRVKLDRIDEEFT